MKETYFLPETIHQKSLKMLQEIQQYTHRQNITFAPEHSALLILDMKRYFLQKSSHAFIPSAPSIIPGIRDLIKAYATRDMSIIFTRHVNSPQNAKMMGKWWKELIREKNTLSEITDEFDTTSGIIIKKSQYDAFYETRLEDILREKKITQLVIGGVMTNLCCETTVRSAFVHGFEVFFTIDGTATYNERLHLATLLNLSYGFAALVLVNELLTILRGEDER
jgi:isochorismate hydrolase